MTDMLYKFYSCETYNLEALANRYLWFSIPKKLNDPFDCNFEGFQGSKAFTAFTKEYKQLMYELFEKFGICSFTQDPLNQHFWSLYANNYSGFCLVFDKNELKRRLFSFGIIVDEVNYLPDAFKIDTELTYQLKKPSDFEVAFDRTLKNAAFSKSKNTWGNENEIRAFLGKIFIDKMNSGENGIKDDHVGYKVPIKEDNLLKQIILGQNMSIENKKLITDIMQENYPHIMVSKIELDYENWKLKVVNL